MKETVGFVGLGAIGGGACRSILHSGRYDVVAYDIAPEKVAAMVDLGARPAASLSDLGRSSDIVVACLPGPSEVRDVFVGRDGFREAMRPRTAIFDLSVVDPETSKELAAQFGARDVIYVDTPHIGSMADAPRGTLSLIVGGTEEELTEYIPFLKKLSSAIHFVGGRGAGSAVKLVNSVMSAGNLLVAAEAFMLGAKAGVDAGTLFNVIQYFGGSSQLLITRFPGVLRGDFSGQFTVALAEKQLALALASARSLSVPMPMATASHDFYHVARDSGRACCDIAGVVEYLEEQLGVQLRGRAQVATLKWGS